jgi:hypothetical protein
MILYLAPVSAEQQMNVSPEEMKKGMEPWLAWYEKSGKAIVDAGSPLAYGIQVTKEGSAKAQTQIAGYTIVQADDMDAAKAMVADHPHFMLPGATIEIYEMMQMPM